MASSAFLTRVEKAGGVTGVVAGELVGAQGERCRLKAVAGAVLTGQGGGQVTLGHAHGGVGAAVPAGGADAEHAADIFGRCLVQQTEHLVHGQHQVAADTDNKLLVPALLQFVVEDVEGVLDELFVHRG